MEDLNLTDRVQNLLTDMERPDSLPLFQASMNFNQGRPSFNASSPLMDMMPNRDTLGSGVMSDNDMVRINKALLSGVQDPMVSNVDTSVMQPLVDLGFEQQVRTIMTYPQNSPESMQAQQEILNEMGTGMDVDAFVQTVKEVAPKEIQEEILRRDRNEDWRLILELSNELPISDLNRKIVGEYTLLNYVVLKQPVYQHGDCSGYPFCSHPVAIYRNPSNVQASTALLARSAYL